LARGSISCGRPIAYFARRVAAPSPDDARLGYSGPRACGQDGQNHGEQRNDLGRQQGTLLALVEGECAPVDFAGAVCADRSNPGRGPGAPAPRFSDVRGELQRPMDTPSASERSSRRDHSPRRKQDSRAGPGPRYAGFIACAVRYASGPPGCGSALAGLSWATVVTPTPELSRPRHPSSDAEWPGARTRRAGGQ
jgi:hypothetical protein